MEAFRNWCIQKIKEYPQLKEEIKGLYSLAVCEIEDGESEDHEIELAENDINELIENLKKNKV